MSEAIIKNAKWVAEKWGVHTVLMLGALWYISAQNENYQKQDRAYAAIREAEIQDWKDRLLSSDEYIRTTLADTISQNTKGFHEMTTAIRELRTEIAKGSR